MSCKYSSKMTAERRQFSRHGVSKQVILFVLCVLNVVLVDAGSAAVLDMCVTDEQCQNGGECREPNDTHPHKYCHCSGGFVGVHCSDYCPLECHNGGYCRYKAMKDPHPFQQDRNPNDYMCQCFGLFEGKNCEVSYVNCGDGRKCYNGGICSFPNGQASAADSNNRDFTARDASSQPTGGATSSCDCPRAYQGDTCQEIVHDSNPIDKVIRQNFSGGSNNKAGAIAMTVILMLLSLGCCWVCMSRWCLAEEPQLYNMLDVLEDEDIRGEPRWRNVV